VTAGPSTSSHREAQDNEPARLSEYNQRWNCGSRPRWEYPLNLKALTVDMTHMENSMNEHTSRTVAPNMFCRSCASPLVQATGWQQESDDVWGVILWCPECGFEQAAILDRSQLLYLSMAIEEGFAWMLEALAEFNAVSPATGDLAFVDRAQTDRINPAPR